MLKFYGKFRREYSKILRVYSFSTKDTLTNNQSLKLPYISTFQSYILSNQTVICHVNYSHMVLISARIYVLSSLTCLGSKAFPIKLPQFGQVTIRFNIVACGYHTEWSHGKIYRM